MPSTRTRTRRRQGEPSLHDQGFLYFGSGDFFDVAPDFAALPEAERWAFWTANRADIIQAFHVDPANDGMRTWGEDLEEIEAALDADE